jgi:hypothetical protein
MKSNIQISIYTIGVIRIPTSEFVSEIIQNIQLALNEIVADNIQICTYLFIGNKQIIPIHLYKMEDKT